MFGNLFVKTDDNSEYRFIGEKIFSILNVAIKEIRESGNSPGGVYMIGEALGLQVFFSEADASDFPDYQFLLSFRPMFDWSFSDRNCLVGFADIVGKHLARENFVVARPLEFGRKGTQSAIYAKLGSKAEIDPAEKPGAE
jgi:hypothetical protein